MMKPRRSPERDPSFASTDEQPPRWPWEQPPAPEGTESKEEPPKPRPEQNKKTEKQKDEKPSDKKTEQTARSRNEKEQNEQERRVTLLERSLTLTKQFEEAPIPKDPHTVARLMIAKRVVAVNEQLETPPAERSESDEEKLLQTLDYLGDLSDKFEDPDAEVSPEIEEAYESILHLAREALAEEEPETLVEHVENLDQPDSATLPPETRPAPSPAAPSVVLPKTHRPRVRTNFAALPIKTIALLKFLLPKRQRNSGPYGQMPATPELHGVSTERTESSYSERDVSSSHSPHTAPERHQAESRATLPFRHLAKSEYLPGRSLPVVAPVILGALALGSRTSSPSSAEIHRPITATPEGSHYHGPASYEQAAHSERRHESHEPTAHAHHELPSAQLLAQPSHELQKTTTAPEVVHASLSAQKFEFMSLHTLLDAATHVSVGHGEYLRRAYEKGQIDKAGLISVLKANAKGRDFITEYRHQADRTRRLKITSPEFLRSQRLPSTDSSLVSEATPQQADAIMEQPASSASPPTPRSSTESISQTLDMLKTEKKVPSQQTWPTGAHPMTGIWIAIGVVATIIVALITVLILTFI